MSTTLLIDSFSEENVQERTELKSGAAAGSSSLDVRSIEGYEVGQTIYVGQLSRDGIEKAVIAALPNETTITLSLALELSHGLYEPVTSVVGSKVRVYRAPNVDGSQPTGDAYIVLGMRELDPDQTATYYTDPDGSSAYWYRRTFYDPTRNVETDLADSYPVRGDDFKHYASVNEIREAAGFRDAYNLRDSDIDQQRRFAESELNASLAAAYTTPFDPVPSLVHDLTVQLAAALLLVAQYSGAAQYRAQLKDVRDRIKAYGTKDGSITDDDGNDLGTGGGVSGYPDSSASRMFTVDQRF
ncbi:hypothetical protein [Streptomyces sp. NPDC056401]|uniref:hypothetical protein n=1 Tax=Streptomyces sp. NPDC056401 TaxID=3345809 RepID=UPI0035DDA8A3